MKDASEQLTHRNVIFIKTWTNQGRTLGFIKNKNNIQEISTTYNRFMSVPVVELSPNFHQAFFLTQTKEACIIF